MIVQSPCGGAKGDGELAAVWSTGGCVSGRDAQPRRNARHLDETYGLNKLCELNVIEQVLNGRTTIVQSAWGRDQQWQCMVDLAQDGLRDQNL